MSNDTMFLGGMFVGAIVVIICLVFAIKENAEWKQYVQEHNCYVVEEIPSKHMVIFGPKGKVSTGYISGQELWRCDNGKEHWRNK